ncbi:MAG TPA: transposase [Longimicrobium sp.]|nr:transposase [Longimicrobium sp.]
MGRPYTQLYAHLVWATWDRMPLIRPDIQPIIYGCIQNQLWKHRCSVIAIGGIDDHVHVLTRFPSTATIAEIVKHAKGASSNLMTQEIARGEFFKWQGYYGAFTLSKGLIPRVRDYVLNQEEHHRLGRLSEELERTTEPDSERQAA